MHPPSRRSSCAFWLIAAAVLSSLPAAAITLGQVDDFQTGTALMWTGGSSISQIPNGGPNGMGDGYLQISTLGSPSNLGAFNTVQWAGDYSAAAVTRVVADLRNFGPDPVSVRMMIVTTAGTGCVNPCTAWTSTNATVLPPASGWVKVEFSLLEPDLTHVAGALSYATTMSSVAKLHIRHDIGLPTPPGSVELVNAALGMDNVIALPEPSTTGGFLAGSLFLAALFPGENRRKRGNRVPSQGYAASLRVGAPNRV